MSDEVTSLVGRLSEVEFIELLLRMLETEERRRVPVVRTLDLTIVLYD